MSVVATISAASSANNSNSNSQGQQQQQQQQTQSLSQTSFPFPQADAAEIKSIRLQDAIAPAELREYRYSHEALPKAEIVSGVLLNLQTGGQDFFSTKGRSAAMMIFLDAIEGQSRPELSGVRLFEVLKQVDQKLEQDGAKLLENVPTAVLAGLESSYDQTIRMMSSLWDTIREEYGIGEASPELLARCGEVKLSCDLPKVGEGVEMIDRLESMSRSLKVVPEVGELFMQALQNFQGTLDQQNQEQMQLFVDVTRSVGVLLAYAEGAIGALGNFRSRVSDLQEGFREVIGPEGANNRADFYQALTAVINVALPEYIGQDLELEAHATQQFAA
jgi:hypothetical protein